MASIRRALLQRFEGLLGGRIAAFQRFAELLIQFGQGVLDGLLLIGSYVRAGQVLEKSLCTLKIIRAACLQRCLPHLFCLWRGVVKRFFVLRTQ